MGEAHISRNGSGTYSLPAGNPVVTGTTISSTTHNNTMSDVATALTDSLAKDGQTTPTADLPMGTYKHTGVGDAAARTQYAAAGQIQDGSFTYIGTVGGTADVITLTPSPVITAYAAGQTYRFIASGANTTNVTVNISGLGAKAITKDGTSALVAGDIQSGQIVSMTYDGTRFQISVGPTGGQIKFPATQNASSDANTLDDYEEGTWTPSLGGTATYNSNGQMGLYCKIGRNVFARGKIDVNVIGTGSQTQISGLPFTSSSSGSNSQVGYAGLFAGAAGNVIAPKLVVITSNTIMSVYTQTAASASDATNNFFTSGTAVTFAVWYDV